MLTRSLLAVTASVKYRAPFASRCPLGSSPCHCVLRPRILRFFALDRNQDGSQLRSSTPLLRHWERIRRRYPQHILLYQVGDFFECFKEDAVTLSETLGITLTRRGVGKDATPMAGIPVRSLDAHLHRLVQAGHRVALCEQVEPASSGSRRLIDRRVTRLVTPGTLVESIQQANENNYLVAVSLPANSALDGNEANNATCRIALDRTSASNQLDTTYLSEVHDACVYYGVAWVDLSTGQEVQCSLESFETIGECLSRLQPREILVRGTLPDDAEACFAYTLLRRVVSDKCLMTRHDERFRYQLPDQTGNGTLTPQERRAVETLFSYIEQTRNPMEDNAEGVASSAERLLCLRPLPLELWPIVRRFDAGGFMRIDASTRRALELHRSLRDPYSRRGSLLAAIDATVTAPGARLLSLRLACPLVDSAAIERRLDAVEFFVKHRAIARETRRSLQHVLDIERIVQRIFLTTGQAVREGRFTDFERVENTNEHLLSSPAIARIQNLIRDLVALGESLGHAQRLRDHIWKRFASKESHHDPCFEAVQRQMDRIRCDNIYNVLSTALEGVLGPGTTVVGVSPPDSEARVRSGDITWPPDSNADGQEARTSDGTRAAATGPASTQAGAIRPGYSAELDAAVVEYERSLQAVGALEQVYREVLGLKTLKVRSNNLLGWHLELTRREASRHQLFQKAQTHGKWEPLGLPVSAANPSPSDIDHHNVPSLMMRNKLTDDAVRRINETQHTVRFRSRLLEHYVANRLQAEARFLRIQQNILLELTHRCAGDPHAREQIRETVAALSELDVAAALAQVAHEHNYCRPVLHRPASEKPRYMIRIENGRHPTVERAVRNFVPNSCYLEIAEDSKIASPSLLVLTAANASGKSTFLRQIALITILAQTGSFVPADHCELHPADRVFARVGAASGDDLLSARSTFFLEMEETAAVLQKATRQSLVVLDEVGRGTSGEDGLAICEAVATALAPRCRTILATHYLEIPRRILERTHPAAKHTRCFTAKVEHDATKRALKFSYRLSEGAASSSFGIEVARLAGVPEPVLRHAESIVQSRNAQKLGTRSGS
jgi:DNA mismatch repair protein MutS